MQKQKSSILQIGLIIPMGRFLMGFHALGISGVFKFIEPEFHFSKIEPGFSLQRSVFSFCMESSLLSGYCR